jgi:hypothetical protein
MPGMSQSRSSSGMWTMQWTTASRPVTRRPAPPPLLRVLPPNASLTRSTRFPPLQGRGWRANLEAPVKLGWSKLRVSPAISTSVARHTWSRAGVICLRPSATIVEELRLQPGPCRSIHSWPCLPLGHLAVPWAGCWDVGQQALLRHDSGIQSPTGDQGLPRPGAPHLEQPAGQNAILLTMKLRRQVTPTTAFERRRPLRFQADLGSQQRGAPDGSAINQEEIVR